MEIKEAVEFIKYFYLSTEKHTREDVDQVEKAQSTIIKAILQDKIDITEK